MRIDSTHRSWMTSTVGFAALATAVYVPYSYGSTGPPSGGSALGIIFGVAGYSLMIYAALLGLRKRFRLRRVGRASTWMRGHLWLGFLSFPLLLFHSGFAAKGGLTNWLMVLLIAVISTGVVGALVQHYLPALMTRLVPLETIYEEIPQIRQQLQAEAEALVAPLFSPALQLAGGARSSAKRVHPIDIEPEALDHFREVYDKTIRRFLADPDSVKNDCSNQERSSALFAMLRTYLPDALHPIVADLESICEEERQLKRQKWMYRCLHGWLLIHVPLSLALIFLGGIHAVVSLWY